MADHTLSGFILFLQAEDGIRHTSVTGVQTCALPIYQLSIYPLLIFDLINLPPIFFSLACTIAPILLNLFATFYIISKENSGNSEFYKYFLKNNTIVSICSVLSGADIEILQVLSSNFAGFNIFTAPFSKQAEIYIFWCSLVGFCFED